MTDRESELAIVAVFVGAMAYGIGLLCALFLKYSMPAGARWLKGREFSISLHEYNVGFALYALVYLLGPFLTIRGWEENAAAVFSYTGAIWLIPVLVQMSKVAKLHSPLLRKYMVWRIWVLWIYCLGNLLSCTLYFLRVEGAWIAQAVSSILTIGHLVANELVFLCRNGFRFLATHPR